MRNLMALAAFLIAVGPASISIAKASPRPGVVTKELLRTSKTLSGQNLKWATTNGQMVASVTDFAPNGVTSVHKHPWSRVVYVEHGPLWVTNFNRHKTDLFQSGQVFVEAVDEWHQGRAGPTGARLVVFDVVPQGTKNVINR